jgi:hypothetical protein
MTSTLSNPPPGELGWRLLVGLVDLAMRRRCASAPAGAPRDKLNAVEDEPARS